jgi:hypothetical protein
VTKKNFCRAVACHGDSDDDVSRRYPAIRATTARSQTTCRCQSKGCPGPADTADTEDTEDTADIADTAAVT